MSTSKKVKPAKSLTTAKPVETIDLSLMRDRIDGLKKHVNALPESKQKSALMSGLEDFYFWTGNFVGNFAKEIGGRAANA